MSEVCSGCGKKVDKDFKFCPYCFQDFNAEIGDGKKHEKSETECLKKEDENISDRDETAKDEEEREDDDSNSDSEKTVAHNELLIGRKYRILEPLHSSSHGTVCKCEFFNDSEYVYIIRDFIIEERHPLKKDALIKELSAKAEYLSNIVHDNVASILEYLFEDKYFYIIYEFTEGKFLDKVVQDHYFKRNEEISEAQILIWAHELSSILSFMHNQEPLPVYCGDLKPYSLMIRNDDKKIIYIHFGLVYFYKILGILELFEPDFSIREKEDDDCSFYDIFCLGTIIYYLATGIDMTKGETYIPVKEKRKNLSKDLINLIETTLGMRDDREFPNIDEIKEEIERMMSEIKPEEIICQNGKEQKPDEFAWQEYLGSKKRSNSIGRGPCFPLKEKWSQSASTCKQNFLVPHKSALLSISDKGYLYSLDYTTGKILKKEMLNINSTGPIIVGNQLLICSSTSQLSINISDLTKKWEFRTKSMILCSPNYIDNKLCYISYDGFLMFVGMDDGKAISMENLSSKVISTPVFDEKRLYIPTLTGSIVAIDLNDRTISWQQNTKFSISAAPTLVNDKVICSNCKGQVFAFNTETGLKLWEVSLKGSISQCVRALEDRVFTISTGGDLISINIETGDRIWETEIKPHADSLFSITESYVYLVNQQNYLFMIDTNSGEIKYYIQLPEKPNDIPLVVNDYIFMSFPSGRIMAFEQLNK